MTLHKNDIDGRDVVVIHGAKLYAENDMVYRAYKTDGNFEPESIEVWKKYASKGGVCIDVGSYTGLYSIVALKAGARYCAAFEPNPAVYERSKYNYILNGLSRKDVPSLQMALGEKRDVVGFTFKKETILTSAGYVSSKGTFKVRQWSIDGLFAGETYPIQIIKIDVERSELAVLKGAIETLQEHKPALIIESLEEPLTRAICDFLYPLGYGAYRTLDERNLFFEPCSNASS